MESCVVGWRMHWRVAGEGGAREAGGEEELWREETAPTMAESDTYTDFLISIIFIDLCFQLLLGGIGRHTSSFQETVSPIRL